MKHRRLLTALHQHSLVNASSIHRILKAHFIQKSTNFDITASNVTVQVQLPRCSGNRGDTAANRRLYFPCNRISEMATEVLLTGSHQHHVRENQIEARIKNGQKNVQGQAILREVSRFLIDTGNIANWNSLKSRKVTQSPASELYYSLLKTLQDWSQVDIPDSENNSDDCFVKNKNSESLENEERGLYKVTVKVFLHKFDARYIKEAIDNVLQELKIQYVDTVYLALPPIDDKTPFVETITPFWQELERLQEAGITTHISSCDLDANRLKMLLDVAKIRPEVNQVNLTSCCHMPEDLVAYAKHVNVLLHTHGDQPVMLSEDSLQELVHSVYPTMERKLSTNWVLRYAVVVKCRGVIMSKGYIASFE